MLDVTEVPVSLIHLGWLVPVRTILGSADWNPGLDTCTESPVNEYGSTVSGKASYTMPSVRSFTPDPSIVTGLYTKSPRLCDTGEVLSLITNWVTVLSSNLITSSPTRISPRESHPRVEETLILSPTPRVDGNAFSNLAFVDSSKLPLIVSGAITMFQITSSATVPWAMTLSTVADA